MTEEVTRSDQINALRARLEDELRQCDELGLTSEAIDLNQAIEKLKARAQSATG